MKKQLRIFLFVTMLLLLLGVTVLAVSAGNFSVYPTSDDMAAGTNKVGGKDYDTIADAITAAGAEQFIKMNNDVSTDTQSYSVSKALTIDGGGYTLTYNGGSGGAPILAISANVTIQNMKFVRWDTSANKYSTGGRAIDISGNRTVVLNNVQIRGGDSAFGALASAANITITGASTYMEEFDGKIIELQNGSKDGTLTIEGGTFKAGLTRKTKVGQVSLFRGAGAKIRITGGSFTTDTADIFVQGDGDYISPVLIENGSFSVTGNGNVFEAWDGNNGKGFGNHTQYVDPNNNDVFIKITNGTFDIASTGKLINTLLDSSWLYQGEGRSEDLTNTPSVVCNGDGIATGRPVVLVTGGTFTGGSTAYMFYDTSTYNTTAPIFKIEGGYFTATRQLLYAGGQATFTIGTRGDNTKPSINNTTLAGTAVGTATIEGGLFRGKLSCQGVALVVNGGDFQHNDDAIIRSVFSDYYDYVSPVVINGGEFTVTSNCAVVELWHGYVEDHNYLGYMNPAQRIDGEYVLLKITDGTFHINGASARAVLAMINVGGLHAENLASPFTPKIYITGGDFDTNQAYLTNGVIQDDIQSDNNNTAHVTVEWYILGGNFGTELTGCRSYWFKFTGFGVYNIGDSTDPTGTTGPACYGGTYSGAPSSIYGAIYVGNKTRLSGELNIYGGYFNRAQGGDNDAIVTGSGAKVTVYGGTFTVVNASIFLQRDTSYISSIDIRDGSFTVTGSGKAVNSWGLGQITARQKLDPDNANVVVWIRGGVFDINGTGQGLWTHITGARASKDDGVINGATSPIYRISGSPVFRSTSGGSKVIFVYDYSTVSAATAPHIQISGGSFTGAATGTGNRMLMTENCNGTITVTDGTFSTNGNSGTALIYSDYSSAYTTHQPTFNIIGGTWQGTTGYWFAGNGNAIVNLGDPLNTSSTYPQFSGNSSNAPFGLWNYHGGFQKSKTGQLNIYSGQYTYTATGSAPMINGHGGSVTIAGGTFSSTSSYIFQCQDRVTISPLHITGGDFTVTKTGAAIICYQYHNDATSDGADTGNDVCGQVRDQTWTYGNIILKIDGGEFHVNAMDATAILTNFNVTGIKEAALSNYPDGILNTADTVYVEITSGTFTTSNNLIDAFIRDGRDDKGRYTRERNSSNPTLNVTYNITGGSFTGGRAWIVLRDNGIFNISGGTFSSGASVGVYPADTIINTVDVSGTEIDSRYIWIQNPSVAGGQLNILGTNSPIFTVTTAKPLINAAGAALNISGGTFNHANTGIWMTDGDMVSNVTITGGTFNATGTKPSILFDATDKNAYDRQEWHEGVVSISGSPTFTVANAANKSISYTTTQTTTNGFTITGGTFDGKIQSTVTAAGHKLLITGGRFKADSGFTDYVPGRGYVGVTDDSSYKRVTAANLHGFAGSQMRLGTDLGVYFYVLKIDAVDSGTPSLVVSDEAGTLDTLTVYTTPENYPDGSAVESGYTLYRFAFDGLPPQRLGDDLDVVFKLTGVAKFANEFSGLRYCRQVRAANPEDGDLLAITGALLNFGAAAQNYSGYKTETLVNATAADITGAETFSAVSEKLAAYGGTIGAAHFVKTEEQGVAARGVRFDTGIQLYVRVVDTTGSETCTYSIDGGDPVACTKVDLGGNRFAFYTGAITLDHFEDNVTFALSTGETCTYSVQAFVYYYQNLEAKAGEKALARALWAYKTAVVGASFNEWAGFDVADVVNP